LLKLKVVFSIKGCATFPSPGENEREEKESAWGRKRRKDLKGGGSGFLQPYLSLHIRQPRDLTLPVRTERRGTPKRTGKWGVPFFTTEGKD